MARITPSQQRTLQQFETVVRLTDTAFRIPGTGFRFGIDPLLGLVPGVGDMAGFIISALLVLSASRSGASGFVLARMTWNICIDALIGAIPFIGDIFDFAYRANQRNLQLLREHYTEDKHKGSALKLVLPLVLLFLLLTGLFIYLSYRLFQFLLS